VVWEASKSKLPYQDLWILNILQYRIMQLLYNTADRHAKLIKNYVHPSTSFKTGKFCASLNVTNSMWIYTGTCLLYIIAVKNTVPKERSSNKIQVSENRTLQGYWLQKMHNYHICTGWLSTGNSYGKSKWLTHRGIMYGYIKILHQGTERKMLQRCHFLPTDTNILLLSARPSLSVTLIHFFHTYNNRFVLAMPAQSRKIS